MPEDQRLMPEPGTVTVRMYRIGHGDCFLIVYREDMGTTEPVYILIDCGYKPGSNSATFINTKPKDILKNLHAATGGHIHVAIITHEHQDHVNAISQDEFSAFTIDEAWFAWTEDPEDPLANALRKQYHDTLVRLVEARNQLALHGAGESLNELDEQLEFSLGGSEPFSAATLLGTDASKSQNKKAMKVFKDLAEARDGVKFLHPHMDAIIVPGSSKLRAFVLGPPRNGPRLKDLDPQDGEGFPAHGLSADTDATFLWQSLASEHVPPFSPRYFVCLERNADGTPLVPEGPHKEFFDKHYGSGAAQEQDTEAEDNAPWRRIDSDWLYAAGQLALKMSNYINNTSLVLAFELTPGGKVLLFAADAQRGNWSSWTDKDILAGDRTVSTQDLLSRTVLYKVGHHGSHNATLNGKSTDKYANLAWMGHGPHENEFTAMITAVREWAIQPSVGWDHPLQSIKDALLHKTAGRVFQTDTAMSAMAKVQDTPQKNWDNFKERSAETPLYFDYTVKF